MIQLIRLIQNSDPINFIFLCIISFIALAFITRVLSKIIIRTHYQEKEKFDGKNSSGTKTRKTEE